LNAKTPLENVTCARFPASSLAALAGLRRFEGVSILADGDRSWAFWEGDDRILRALFPIEGIEFFEHREGAWFRLGRRLPCFEVPESGQAVAIDRAIFPGPFPVVDPAEASPIPATLSLVREGRQRPSTAAICPLVELGHWIDSAPSNEIEAVRGAILGDLALLLGPGLPLWPGSIRYWGERVLVPIGFQVRPNLPEAAIIESLGGSGLELFRFVEGEKAAVELIPLDAFRPLSRAGARLALRARSS
jgi:MoxR-vWA-beta-propeller ternary system domain bpX2